MRFLTKKFFIFSRAASKIPNRKIEGFFMSYLRFLSCSFFLLVTISISVYPLVATDSSNFNSDILKHIKWREIGPANFGGRISDIEAVPENPKIIFVASASGGIFKSVNNGVTWQPVFDEEGTSLSIGDIAIAPSDPNIIWAGTGEPNNRQSSSWGDGVYKSIDGGETWRYMGLKETHHIGRIVIHPQNLDIVYVAALGHLWGTNPERGLYRTKDGGKTWEKILFINKDTGAVDVAIERNGRVLYAAAYQRRRRAWGFVGGGLHSGLYRSMDGGDTWEKLSKGLPEGDTGRIGIDISKSHPNIVYAIVQNKDGGVFRSEDRGQTWTRVSESNPRPSYYSQIRIDPLNPNKVWMLGSRLSVSIDGGKTFSVAAVEIRRSDRDKKAAENVHVDHHALWIDPKDPDHLLLGNDGGFYISYDGSKNWDFIDNLPIAQYYAIGVDNREPYWIYGGTQDNGTWGIPSRTYSSRLGIRNSDVVNIANGDGFYVALDPQDHTAIYAETQNGRLLFVDLETKEEKSLQPVPEDPKEEYRFNWKSPLILSPHNSNILYYGGNKLFKTSDRGHSWEVISTDLTLNQDWKKIAIMGVIRNEDTLSRDDGVAHFGTITTLCESPLQSGLIYVGTDDGNVQMTQDGGKTWQNLSEKFRLPGPRWVSRVLTSHHGAGTAYISFDGHQDDDFKPYIFKTTDFGKTWKSISEGIPDGMAVNVLAEHPRNADLLLAGTEFGLFVTIDGGKSWILAGESLPRAPVDDIVIHARENDIVLGTHGRSIIILDDIAMLEHLDEKVLDSEAHLFPPGDAIQFHDRMEVATDQGAAEFSGTNPDYGALITYYLKSDPSPPEEKASTKGEEDKEESRKQEEKPKVKIVILDKEEKVVRELEGPDRKGFNRISWNLRYPLSFESRVDDGGWYERQKGPFALPGEYTIKLIARKQELIQKFQVMIDPRAKTTPEALQARFEASMKVMEMQRAFVEAQKAIEEMEKEMKRIKEMVKDKEKVSEKIRDRIKNISEKLDKIKEIFKRGRRGPRSEIWSLARQLQASSSAPTQSQLRKMQHLMTKVVENIEKVNTLLTQEFPELQSELEKGGIRPVIHKPIKLLKRCKDR